MIGKHISKLEMNLELTKADLASTKADLASTKADLASTKADLEANFVKAGNIPAVLLVLSNEMDIDEKIATQGKVARNVWETGGSAGEDHQKSPHTGGIVKFLLIASIIGAGRA